MEGFSFITFNYLTAILHQKQDFMFKFTSRCYHEAFDLTLNLHILSTRQQLCRS